MRVEFSTSKQVFWPKLAKQMHWLTCLGRRHTENVAKHLFETRLGYNILYYAFLIDWVISDEWKKCHDKLYPEKVGKHYLKQDWSNLSVYLQKSKIWFKVSTMPFRIKILQWHKSTNNQLAKPCFTYMFLCTLLESVYLAEVGAGKEANTLIGHNWRDVCGWGAQTWQGGEGWDHFLAETHTHTWRQRTEAGSPGPLLRHLIVIQIRSSVHKKIYRIRVEITHIHTHKGTEQRLGHPALCEGTWS